MKVVIKKEVVAQCLKSLRRRRAHEHFAGYLCLQHLAAITKGVKNLQPNFVDFFDQFFRVKGPKEAFPYIKLFINQEPSESNLWLNRNVAGSYAPSSLRETFKKVVTVSDRKYSLRPNHAKMAFEHLLLGARLNAIDLAIVLYRDYAFIGKNTKIDDVVSVFASEFGYVAADGALTADFNTLYSVDVPEAINAEWSQPHE